MKEGILTFCLLKILWKGKLSLYFPHHLILKGNKSWNKISTIPFLYFCYSLYGNEIYNLLEELFCLYQETCKPSKWWKRSKQYFLELVIEKLKSPTFKPSLLKWVFTPFVLKWTWQLQPLSAATWFLPEAEGTNTLMNQWQTCTVYFWKCKFFIAYHWDFLLFLLN